MTIAHTQAENYESIARGALNNIEEALQKNDTRTLVYESVRFAGLMDLCQAAFESIEDYYDAKAAAQLCQVSSARTYLNDAAANRRALTN